MRCGSAVWLGGCATLIFAACGGSPFAVGSAADDATAGDALDDGREADSLWTDAASLDAGAPDVRDARPARDAAAGDAAAADEPTTHCGGAFACVPEVPAGWVGPLELHAAPGAPPACGANFSGAVIDGQAGLTAPQASCACACGSAAGVQCSSPTLSFYASSATCGLNTPCASRVLTQGACTLVDVTSGCGALPGVTMSLPATTASLGGCAPLTATTVPAATWATRARACGASLAPVQTDCAAGSLCVPTPAAPFGPSVCIEHSGDVVCPATVYTAKALYYGALSDTRGCSDCTCGPVTGSRCSGNVSQFVSGDAGCSVAQTIYPLGQTCDPVQQPASLELTLTASGGSCAPSPVLPNGTATPSLPMTFCCTP